MAGNVLIISIILILLIIVVLARYEHLVPMR